MDVLLIMCLGILAGRFVIPARAKKGNDSLSLLCTILLIFSMGVMLGRKDHFLQELSTLGWSSLLLFLIPTVLSILFVFFLTELFLKKKKPDSQKEIKK